MKKLIVCGLALSMLLCGCGAKPSESTAPAGTTAAATTEAATVPTAEPTTEPTSAPTTVPAETEPVDRNPLTGEALQEVKNQRPIAVMLNNHKAALPQCGISKADILYEILAEGDITRFTAYFSDVSEAGPIGPVRSLRAYYLDIMRGYNAICVSAGGSREADNMVYSLGYDRINALGGYGAGSFYRDEWRKNNRGYEHSLFIKGENLLKAAGEAGMKLSDDDRDYGLTFDDSVPFGGEEVREILVHFISSNSTKLTYEPEKGGYTAFQQGQTLIDGNNDEELVFRNVLVLHADTYVMDDEGHRKVQTTGENTGLYARDGRLIEIRWERDDEKSDFRYYDLEGNPLIFGTGKTYVAVIPESASVDLS